VLSNTVFYVQNKQDNEGAQTMQAAFYQNLRGPAAKQWGWPCPTPYNFSTAETFAGTRGT